MGSAAMAVHTIPDLLATWPWPQAINDMYEDVRDEANQWVESLNLFESSEYKKFEKCNFNLLASFIGPLESRDHLRIACDLMNFYFAFDEYTDVADSKQATKIVHDVMQTLRTRPLTGSHNIIAEMARQFILRVVAVFGHELDAIQRFIRDFDAYATAVIVEAEERAKMVVRSVDEYFTLRRDTCGAFPTFSFFAIGLGIPDHVFDHPSLKSLAESATDLIAITNDMHSYPLEYARGICAHNVVTSIINEHKVDLQGALDWLAEFSAKTISKFCADMELVPSWGPEIDEGVREYINRLGRCVRGYDSWSYETERYYGQLGRQVKSHRRVTLERKDKGYVSKGELATRIDM